MKFATILVILVFAATATLAANITGIVYEDQNDNGIRDESEPGIADVAVSNQIDVVLTDNEGRYQLPVRDQMVVFISQPVGYRVPLDEVNLPQFFYVHAPDGSSSDVNWRFEGVSPTGNLPEYIDFPLIREQHKSTFRMIAMADPQPRNEREIDFIRDDVVAQMIGTEAEMAIVHGDIMFDDLSLFESNNALIALIGVPWYNVIGNHDMNYDSPDDAHSDETYERYYGPNYFAYNHGPVTFIALDNVIWGGKKPEGSGNYTGGLGTDQLAFVEKLMPHIPKDRLIVLMMHIPLFNTADKEQLFRLIEDRPYTFSISGHTHWHANRFLGEAEGWHGREPHHHVVNVTVSGNWWAGEPDEFGIPHTMMNDGAPNGYTILNFDREKVVIDYKVARRPASYQMNILAPTEVESATASETFVYVNVFNGSERSTVRMRIGAGSGWVDLEKSVDEDPYYLALKEFEKTNPEKLTNRALGNPSKSDHLWKAPVPAGLPAGEHLIYVETEDMYGRIFNASRSLRVK